MTTFFRFINLCIFIDMIFGETIPVPTLSQFAYQQRGIVALTHFNMGTFYGDGDPTCNSQNWNENNDKGSSNPQNFAPLKLNISNWAQSYLALGVKSAVLTSKHGCGFCLWPTKAFNNTYNYSSPFSLSPITDIIQNFVTVMSQNNIGFGFYYSLSNNYYLNAYNHYVQSTDKLIPNQRNITQTQYEEIQMEQLTELMTNYGNLTEFWFDGGTRNLSPNVTKLISKLQPTMLVYSELYEYNGFNQIVSPNMARWIGTESGMNSEPVWSMGVNPGNGDPNSTIYSAVGADTTLQNGDHWFYTPSAGLRTLQTLIAVYHDTVGNNAVMELDFAIDQTGNVANDQYEQYETFGNWIRNCYGQNNIINSTQNKQINQQNGSINLQILTPNLMIDRVMIQEDIMYGQRVRNFSIIVNGKNLYKSTAIGYKRIIIFKQNISTPIQMQFVANIFVGQSVYIANFAAFAPCPRS